MALNIKPLGTRVVVKVQEAETKTKSGIYIPDSAKEKPQRGEIVAVGNGTKDEAMELKSGDIVRVIGGPFCGVEGRVARVAGQQRVIVTINGLCSVATAYVPSAFLEVIGNQKSA